MEPLELEPYLRRTRQTAMPVDNSTPAIIARFHEAHPRPTIGDRFALPDIGQEFEIIGFDRRHVPNRPLKTVNLVIGSRCAECGRNFEFAAKTKFSYPTRTCIEHRKLWRYADYRRGKVNSALKPRKPKPEPEVSRARKAHRHATRHAPLTVTILRAFDALAVIGESVRRDDVVDMMVGYIVAPPPGARDTRRQSVLRALRTLTERGALPPFVEATPTHFVFS